MSALPVAAAPGLLSVGTHVYRFHCHLSFPEPPGRLPILPPWQQAQVTRALCISAPWKSSPMCTLALGHDNLGHVGVHPDTEDMTEPSVQDLVERAALPAWWHRRNRAGLLRHGRPQGRPRLPIWNGSARFRTHPRRPGPQAAGHPHPRASADTLAILRKRGEMAPATQAGGVFHCFTESMEVAKAALDMGYTSRSRASHLQERAGPARVAAFVAGPHADRNRQSLSGPVPYRGKTNNPSYVPYVAQQMAQVRGICRRGGPDHQRQL
jgi:TatD DNase family protein